MWQCVGFMVAGIAVALLATATSPGFDPTGMIYVDIARHIARGDGIAASIFFPSHVPVLPSPIALWPPLYPAAIAGASALGIDPILAARLVPLAAFGVTVSMVWLVGSSVFGRQAGTPAAVLLLAWPSVTGIAAMALSEPLFMMLVLLSVAVTAPLLERGPSRRTAATATAGGMVMAAAALTRYPGIALIAVGIGALVVLGHGRVRDRVAVASVWGSAAAVPTALLLVRNRLVTGSFLGTGRPPAESGVITHLVFGLKTIAADTAALIGRITVVPEALHVSAGTVTIGTAAAATVVLWALWRRGGLGSSLSAALGTPGRQFVTLMGVGYWVAMTVIRSVTSFEPLNTRMMMPAYPIIVLPATAALSAIAQRLGMPARRFTGLVGFLGVLSVVLLLVPQSLAAGGARLAPAPAPAWVQWVAAHTPPGTPVVGNRPFEANFYLQRPTYSFQVFAVYRSGDRFDRDCSLISRHLAALGWTGASLVLHAEDGAFDAEIMGRRYGPTVARLLHGEQPLPVRLVARQSDFAVYKILDVRWPCAGVPSAQGGNAR